MPPAWKLAGCAAIAAAIHEGMPPATLAAPPLPFRLTRGARLAAGGTPEPAPIEPEEPAAGATGGSAAGGMGPEAEAAAAGCKAAA